MSELITVWVLSVQLWTDQPNKINFVYNKEYPTYEECILAREEWTKQKDHTVLCLLKTTPIKNEISK
jgi:hypothetical protein